MRKIPIKDVKKLAKLMEEIHTGVAAPLTATERLAVAAHLARTDLEGEESAYLWATAELSEPAEELRNLAGRALDEYAEDKSRPCPAYPLRYLLNTSSAAERDQLIETYRSPRHYMLAMTVAEFLLKNGNVEEGLRTMIDIVPLTGADHSTSNSIALWINELGTSDLKNELIFQAAEAIVQNDHPKRDLLVWAANLIHKW